MSKATADKVVNVTKVIDAAIKRAAVQATERQFEDLIYNTADKIARKQAKAQKATLEAALTKALAEKFNAELPKVVADLVKQANLSYEIY